jgi:hypothetical protein
VERDHEGHALTAVQQQNLIETILGRRIAQAEKAVLLVARRRSVPSPIDREKWWPDLASASVARLLDSLRRRAEATKGQDDHAEKSDFRAAVLALPQGWAAKGRH